MKNPEIRKNPEEWHPCILLLGILMSPLTSHVSAFDICCSSIYVLGNIGH